MVYAETNLRWAKAVGYTADEMAGLTRQEMEEFDTLCFQKYGPDQVTFGTQDNIRYEELLAKIESYSQ